METKEKFKVAYYTDADVDTLVVATHGFIKKTDKTPSKEIERAYEIMKEYFDFKR